MKTYSLLRLQYWSNKVIFTCQANSVEEASEKFNRSIAGVQLNSKEYAEIGGVQLNSAGYAVFSDTVVFCVAEHWEPCYMLP